MQSPHGAERYPDARYCKVFPAILNLARRRATRSRSASRVQGSARSPHEAQRCADVVQKDSYCVTSAGRPPDYPAQCTELRGNIYRHYSPRINIPRPNG